jgi:hypothetical protein
MQLDIYAFDAGDIDGPRYYGRMDSDKFKAQFPRGFAPIHELAKSFGCRFGIWLGPDGFGDTSAEEQARINLLQRYRDIMVKGMVLDETRYGPLAVARGNDTTRLITLRNLDWQPVVRHVK